MNTCVTCTSVIYCDGTAQTTAAKTPSTACVFTSTGTWTVPAGVYKVKVTVTGGGSAGDYNSACSMQGGGGSGGTAVKWYSVTPGCAACVIIGAGGTWSFKYYDFSYGYTCGGATSGGISCFCYLGTTVCGTGGTPYKCWGFASGSSPSTIGNSSASGIGVGGDYMLAGETAWCSTGTNGNASAVGNGAQVCGLCQCPYFGQFMFVCAAAGRGGGGAQGAAGGSGQVIIEY